MENKGDHGVVTLIHDNHFLIRNKYSRLNIKYIPSLIVYQLYVSFPTASETNVKPGCK